VFQVELENDEWEWMDICEEPVTTRRFPIAARSPETPSFLSGGILLKVARRSTGITPSELTGRDNSLRNITHKTPHVSPIPQ